jgi:hypothetical protein
MGDGYRLHGVPIINLPLRFQGSLEITHALIALPNSTMIKSTGILQRRYASALGTVLFENSA